MHRTRQARAPFSLKTIHGAKGLEFDHVFVLGVAGADAATMCACLNWLELPRAGGGDHLLMAPIRVRDDDGQEEDAINPFIELLHKERSRAERSRLAYVALTRARRSLHCTCIRARTRPQRDGFQR